MSQFEHLFQPIRLKGTLIRNRTVMAPMNSYFANPNGEVNSHLIDYYVERAKGGVGLILTSASTVDAKTNKGIGELSICSDDFISGLKRLTDEVHSEGAKIFMQIYHGGREFVSNTTMEFSDRPVGPSALPDPLTGKPCHELTIQELHAIQAKFIQAAQRAEQAGFDGVEIHGAHGYLITQFTYAFANRRVDEYGGGFKGRIRFPLEIIEGIRKTTGDLFLISYRMNVNEVFERGLHLQIDESLSLAKEICKSVDLIHVSTGTVGSQKGLRKAIPLMSEAQGCYAHLAAAVKKVVDVPVICVGRITTPEIAESILARGDADMVAIGRGLLTDPYWVNKAKRGEVDEIRQCVSCNQGCVEYLIKDRKITCLHNPALGNERELAITKTQNRKKVLIIGGGVAGMEAARVATLRGHKVQIWEKGDSLGGNANIASITPWKKQFKKVVDYLLYEMQKLNISIKFCSEGTTLGIMHYKPDAVILATGARPKTSPYFDSKMTRAFLAEEVLLGKVANIVSPVCVIGGGSVGLETAAFLKLYGHDVAVIEMLPKLGTDMGAINRGFWFDKMLELGVSIHTGCQIIGFEDNRLQLQAHLEKTKKEMKPFSSYVIAIGYEANDLLTKELDARKDKLLFPIYSIGDCVSPRNALYAIHEGYRVAYAL